MKEDTAQAWQANSNRLVDKVTADIQSGALAPGLWLKQVDIERRYDVTRNTARSALQKLALQRYVEHEINRGYRVPSIDGQKRDELLKLRIVIETSVVPEIMANLTEEAVRELRDLADAFNKLVPSGQFLKLNEVNAAFHRRLYQIAGNQEASRTIQDFRRTWGPFPGMNWDSQERIIKSGQEHKAMVEAIARKDGDRLMRLIALHIGKNRFKKLRIVDLQLR